MNKKIYAIRNLFAYIAHCIEDSMKKATLNQQSKKHQ